MLKIHHGRMEHKLNSKEKHNLGWMASLSNPNTKLKALHDTSMDEPYQSKRRIKKREYQISKERKWLKLEGPWYPFTGGGEAHP